MRTLSIQIIGAGRMGRAMVAALRASGTQVPDPGARGATGEGADVVVLAVPDAAIADAASHLTVGPIVAHLSGATTLEPLHPHECFSLHPLVTVSGHESGAAGEVFRGVHAAVAASSQRAQTIAEQLASMLGMTSFYLADEHRPAYHAAAAIASNYLVTLEGVAERLARSVGVSRDALLPLVTATVHNWGSHGAAQALTGPIARGDEATVAWQREAVAELLPEELELFDALAEATRRLAAERDRG